MKPIKFRVWDKESKEMIYPNPLSYQKFLIDSCGNLCGIDLTTFTWMGILPKSRYQVQWEIGLKDKNGKEIYEGDIVQTYNGVKGLVKHGFHIDSCIESEYPDNYTDCDGNERKDYGWYVEQLDGDSYSLDSHAYIWITIIGNMCENSELIA